MVGKVTLHAYLAMLHLVLQSSMQLMPKGQAPQRGSNWCSPPLNLLLGSGQTPLQSQAKPWPEASTTACVCQVVHAALHECVLMLRQNCPLISLFVPVCVCFCLCLSLCSAVFVCLDLSDCGLMTVSLSACLCAITYRSCDGAGIGLQAGPTDLLIVLVIYEGKQPRSATAFIASNTVAYNSLLCFGQFDSKLCMQQQPCAAMWRKQKCCAASLQTLKETLLAAKLKRNPCQRGQQWSLNVCKTGVLSMTMFTKQQPCALSVTVLPV